MEFAISTDRFELGDLVSRQTGLRAELERIVPTGNNAIPYVWVTGSAEGLADLTSVLEASEVITSVDILDELTTRDGDDQYLYRIEWKLGQLDIIRGIIESAGAILEGESVNGYWVLRFRFEGHSNMAEFYQYLVDNDITDFSIETITELQSGGERGPTANLTPEQREALRLAAQEGYFESPREVTLEELGTELGITQQAVSQRLRRATRHIVFDVLHLPQVTQME